MTDFPDLGPATERMAGIAAAVPDERLADPTPCTGTPVAALLGHVLSLAEAFRGAAAKEPDPGPPPAQPPALPDGWRTVLPERLDALAAAWREPDALVGSTSAGGLTMPAPVAAAVTLDELVLHGWDLARAVGLDYEPGTAEVEACLGFVEPTASPQGVPGLFGPIVAVAPDATSFDRLLGLSGRDPRWTPAG
jgi:uncharacterized protein (TIGR03086 family)